MAHSWSKISKTEERREGEWKRESEGGKNGRGGKKMAR